MYQDSTVKKIEEIQYVLAIGKTRPEVARMLGCKDVTALYHFATRNKLKWNDEKKNYDATGNNGKPIEAAKPPLDNPTGKEANIILMFERGMDGREIAKKPRFANYQAMADYMKSKGYVWSEFKDNYVKEPKEIKKKKEQLKAEAKPEISPFGKYDDMLKMTYENIDKLKELLNIQNEQKTMPRFILSGHPIYKTIGIIDPLDRMIKDFCSENNMTQKELFEVAVIEFLKKYEYQDEVKANLKV